MALTPFFVTVAQKMLVAFFPIYSRFALVGGSIVLWIFIIQYYSGIMAGIMFNFSFDIGVPGMATLWWETSYGSQVARIHSEFGNLTFLVLFVHILFKIYSRASQAEIDHTWLSGVLILVLVYVAGVTGAIMPCSILSEVTATIVGYSLNSVVIVSFDFMETILVPGLGLTDETMSRVFFVHFVVPTIVLIILIDHLNNLHLTEYMDEDEIDVVMLFKREYILEFFAIETYLWFEYFLIFFTLRMTVDFFWPSYMVVTYTLSNLEFWPIFENINYVIAVPHWYLRPLMSALVTIPHHYLGFIYVILLFIVLLFQPWFDDNQKSLYAYTKTVNVFYRLPIDVTLYSRYCFFYMCASLIYICSIVPTGRYFIPLGGNEGIVQVFWFILLYFLIIYRLPYFLSNLTFAYSRYILRKQKTPKKRELRKARRQGFLRWIKIGNDFWDSWDDNRW